MPTSSPAPEQPWRGCSRPAIAGRRRALGTAERERPLVHAGMAGDITVGTGAAATEEVAAEIFRFPEGRA